LRRISQGGCKRTTYAPSEWRRNGRGKFGSRERGYKTDCRSKQRPARGHFTDDLKAAGNATAVVVASPIVAVGAAGVTVGAALVGVVTGHPIQVVKETGGRVIEDAAAVVEWVGGWF
jgi:hypothetical protein